MSKFLRFAALTVAVAVLVACGKSQTDQQDLPLAFVPADTLFVFANSEPMPKDVLDAQSRKMQSMWPIVFGMYDKMLDQISHEAKTPIDEKSTKLAHALLDEFRTRDTLDKLRELGFKPDGHIAFYSVGVMPVLRTELGDPAALKAMIARIEQKVGTQMATGKLGAQEYWYVGDEKLSFVMAIQNTHLVITGWPNAVSDATKQALLGLTRPEKNLADAGTLQTIAKQYGYTPYGVGYFDTVALVQRLTTMPSGTDQDLAKSLEIPVEQIAKIEPACKDEGLALARKFPRLIFGTEKIQAGQTKVGFQLELDPELAKQVMDYAIPAPGTGAPAQGLYDISLSIPVLKIQEFWTKQLDAVAAKPFACPELAMLIALKLPSLRATLNTAIPTPFSDLTGMRLTLDHIELHGKDVPDISARALVDMNNPLGAFGMAQLVLPQLKDVKIAADGKPVAVPLPDLPASVPPLSIALSDKAIALSAGKDTAVSLGDYLAAPSAATPIVMRVHMDGKIFDIFGTFIDQIKDTLTAEQLQVFELEKQIFAIDAKLLHSVDFEVEVNAHGIGVHETVDGAQ
ncbi:MAG: hypothetical protein LBQ20_10200 [Rhodanobacter sp.]|nr:hypothetical protein [Rhodanobacter sp.]